MASSFICDRLWNKTLAALATLVAGCALGAAAEPDAKPSGAVKPPERITIAVDRGKFGEGWKQTIPIETSGDVYDLWVEDGWLFARRCDKDGALDWQIVLARVVGDELPQIRRIGSDHFSVLYRNGRFFIRETGDVLRVMREFKIARGLFERTAVLREETKSGGYGASGLRMLSSWQQDDWFFVGLGPGKQRFDAFIRLDHTKNSSRFSVLADSGFLHEVHGQTWVMDDGDLLVCLRTPKSTFDAQVARKKVQDSVLASGPPAIDAASWLNTDDALSWEKLRGKVVLLDFWGTWCGPCVEKLPQVQEFSNRYNGRDVVVIGIHSSQGGETCADFVSKNGITFPIAIDTGKTAESFAIDAWPSVFLFDKSGKVVRGYEHDLPSDELVEELLKQ